MHSLRSMNNRMTSNASLLRTNAGQAIASGQRLYISLQQARLVGKSWCELKGENRRGCLGSESCQGCLRQSVLAWCGAAAAGRGSGSHSSNIGGLQQVTHNPLSRMSTRQKICGKRRVHEGCTRMKLLCLLSHKRSQDCCMMLVMHTPATIAIKDLIIDCLATLQVFYCRIASTICKYWQYYCAIQNQPPSISIVNFIELGRLCN